MASVAPWRTCLTVESKSDLAANKNAQPFLVNAQKKLMVFMKTSLCMSSCGTSSVVGTAWASSCQLMNEWVHGSSDRNKQYLSPLPVARMRHRLNISRIKNLHDILSFLHRMGLPNLLFSNWHVTLAHPPCLSPSKYWKLSHGWTKHSGSRSTLKMWAMARPRVSPVLGYSTIVLSGCSTIRPAVASQVTLSRPLAMSTLVKVEAHRGSYCTVTMAGAGG